jgi:hypothetical protein
MEQPDFQTYPVVRLDMSGVLTSQSSEEMKESICEMIYRNAKARNVSIRPGLSYVDAYNEFIFNCSMQSSKGVIILIDEYDKPYVNWMHNKQRAEDMRLILRDLYGLIKAMDEYIHFVFITGVSKFARMGVFSKLNSLSDLSMNDQYAGIVGWTAEELAQNFSPYLELAAQANKTTVKKTIERMKKIYDGFSFDGKTMLFNPYSTLRFFNDGYKYNNFWMEAGTVNMLAAYLKEKQLTVEQFRNFPIDNDFARIPGELESTPPQGFLYQGGFLTLRKGKKSDYLLDFPNEETLGTLSALFTANSLDQPDSYFGYKLSLFDALEAMNIDEIVSIFNQLYQGMPFDDYTSGAKQSILLKDKGYTVQEWLYRSTLLAFLRGVGIVTFGEMHNAKGREDIVISYRKRIVVLELKVAEKDAPPSENADAKLEQAVEQIITHRYGAQYKAATRLALVIDDAERQITRWRVV